MLFQPVLLKLTYMIKSTKTPFKKVSCLGVENMVRPQDLYPYFGNLCDAWVFRERVDI